MKATLVKVDVVSADLGKTAKHIFDLVAGGSLLEPGLVWVFDVSQRTDRGRRDLRFWRAEVEARANGKAAGVRGLEIDAVIDRILPEGRMNLHAGELDLLWQLRPCRRFNLNRQLTQQRYYEPRDYSREELVTFLKRRWLGACYHRPHWQKAPTVPGRARCSSPCGTAASTGRSVRANPARARGHDLPGRQVKD